MVVEGNTCGPDQNKATGERITGAFVSVQKTMSITVTGQRRYGEPGSSELMVPIHVGYICAS